MGCDGVQRAWSERLAMTAMFVGNGTAFGAWAGNIPRLREEAGLSEAGLGVVLLCVSLGAVGAMQVAGRYGGAVGTARGCWLSAVLLALALPLPAVAPGMGGLLGSAVLLGLGLGLLDVCMNAHAAWMERRWGAAIMSSFHAGWSVGQLLGAAVAGVLAGVALAGSLAVAGGVVLGCGLAAVWLPEERGRSRAPVPYAWPSRRLALLGLVVALSFAVEGGTADWSGVYLRSVLGVPAALGSVGLGLFAGTMVLMRLTGDAVVRRLGRGRVLMGGGLLSAAGMALALGTGEVWVAGAGFALVGAGVANIVPVAFSAAAEGDGTVDGAAGVSIVATAGYGAVMATPPLIGVLAEGVGLRAALVVLVAAGGVMAVVGGMAGRR